jgi:hypothetical protein
MKNILNAGDDGLPITSYQWLPPMTVSSALETPKPWLCMYMVPWPCCVHVYKSLPIPFPTYSHMLRNEYSRKCQVTWHLLTVYQWLRQAEEYKNLFWICSFTPSNAETHVPLPHIYLHTTVSRSVFQHPVAFIYTLLHSVLQSLMLLIFKYISFYSSTTCLANIRFYCYYCYSCFIVILLL